MNIENTLPECYAYPAVVADCYEGGVWVLNFPDLSGCWCEGISPEDVIEKAPRTLGDYLAFREKTGVPPIPSDPAELAGAGVGAVVVITVCMNEYRSELS